MQAILLALALMTTLPDNLGQIKTDVDAVRLLHQDGVIDDIYAHALERDLLNQASTIQDRPINYAALVELTKSMVDQVKSFFNFTHALLIIAVFIGIVALILAIGWHYLDILLHIPGVVYEVVTYSLSIGAIALGVYLLPDYVLYAVFPGCLGFIGCFALTETLHKPKLTAAAYTLLCAIIWSVVAVCFQSSVIGFISIMALLGAVGLTDMFDPFYKLFGYSDDEHAFRLTIASFAVLAFHVISHVTGTDTGKLAVFSVGSEWMGTFGYFFGVLCLASRYYRRDGYGGLYIPTQFIAIASGIAALYLGNMFGMPYLRGVGGTFFCIYILEKYFELPWEGIGWAWAALGLAVMIYVVAIFAQSHPQYFLFVR